MMSKWYRRNVQQWRLTVLSCVLAIGAAPVSASQVDPDPRRGQEAQRHVVLVTIDGLRGDYLTESDRYGLKIPNLRRLMHEGSYSGRTLSVFPTLTGPAHTSLITGAGVGTHGILGNNRFDPSVWEWDKDNYNRQPSYREHRWIKVQTLWSAAQASGLKTAALGWPQIQGSPVDYRASVLAASTAAESRARILRSASPGWLDQIEETLGPLGAVDLRMADHLKALIASEVLRRFAPAFMAVHFSMTDAVQHANGPGTPAALVAMEVADQNVGVLLRGIANAGLNNRTTVIVTGDHGFIRMHTEIAINLPLIEAGLIERDGENHPRWQAIIAPNRGLGSLYVQNPNDRDVIARARHALETYAARYPARFRVLDRDEMDRYKADPDAVLGIEPLAGYVIDGRLEPPFTQPHRRAAGHGYSPDTPGMETGVIISGAGIRAGVVLPVSQTIDIAPTIAALLGLELPKADGKAMAGIFKE
jgi:predicted AlkP superfamily pyrophosphatase or phosphodiesterase